MKKILSSIALVLIVSGCGNHTVASKPTPTVTVTATPAASPSQSFVDQTFLTSARNVDPVLNTLDDKTLIDVAKGVCHLMTLGDTPSQVSDILKSYKITPTDIGILMAGAGIAYCPQYNDELKGWAATQ